MTVLGDLHTLDKLLEELARHPEESQCELLREQLEAARRSLAGALPAEYEVNLHLASEVLNCVVDRRLRTRLEEFIQSQLQGLRDID